MSCDSRLREELVDAPRASCPRHGLVVWTGGNVSARDPETGLVAIKPSGVRYEDLTAESMVVVDLDGDVVEGTSSRRPTRPATCTSIATGPTSTASSTPTRATRPRSRRSGRPIPVYLTAQADEFGGEIPCAGFCARRRRGDRPARGRGDRAARRRSCSRTTACSPIGPTGEGGGQGRGDDRGRRRDGVHGPPARARPRRSRPTSSASSTTATRTCTANDGTVTPPGVSDVLSLGASEVWFVTGSQHLYGPETLEHVADHARRDRRRARRGRRHPGPRRRRSRCSPTPDGIRAAVPGGRTPIRPASA